MVIQGQFQVFSPPGRHSSRWTVHLPTTSPHCIPFHPHTCKCLPWSYILLLFASFPTAHPAPSSHPFPSQPVYKAESAAAIGAIDTLVLPQCITIVYPFFIDGQLEAWVQTGRRGKGMLMLALWWYVLVYKTCNLTHFSLTCIDNALSCSQIHFFWLLAHLVHELLGEMLMALWSFGGVCHRKDLQGWGGVQRCNWKWLLSPKALLEPSQFNQNPHLQEQL